METESVIIEISFKIQSVIIDSLNFQRNELYGVISRYLNYPGLTQRNFNKYWYHEMVGRCVVKYVRTVHAIYDVCGDETWPKE
jgi:hypothetical protein